MDALWGKIIKARAGYKCEVCGSKNALNAAHIISRSRKATRWLLSNGVCLCAGHHMNFHRHPFNFYEWVEQMRGRGQVANLRILSSGASSLLPKKPDLVMEVLHLKALAKEYGV